MMTQDNEGSTYSALAYRSNDAFDKSLAFDAQQRLGAPHPAGLARGKNNSDDHAFF
jgi:hypothetical protein